MSTVYQFVEDVKQYAEIESAISGGGVNRMKIKSQKRRRNEFQKKRWTTNQTVYND
jgi:hypothetical protein